MAGENLYSIAKYEDLKLLRELYKNILSLEKEASKGNDTALAIYLDIKAALEPQKRIITIKQRFCIIRVLIEGYTMEEVGEMLHCGSSSISNHVKGGLKKISKALINGEVHNNKAEFIANNYGTMTAQQIADHLNMKKETVKSIWHRIKKGEKR